MDDRVTLAREIAARTKPRFIDTNPVPMDHKMLARIIAAQSKPRFVTIERERPVASTSPRMSCKPSAPASRQRSIAVA
jgi:hypothetical protein